MKISLRVAGKICVAYLAITAWAHAETYTYPQLVQRLTDLRQLAQLPPEGETTSMASSYDRSSRYDAAQDKYIKWAANADGGGVVRKEGDESVLAEIQGPGCIWRIWSALAGSGHVKIYLDGAVAPTIDLPFSEYFYGKEGLFLSRPHLAYTLRYHPNDALGLDNYTPISFQKSCKVVADKNWGKYYQITYTRFPIGTIVPTFQSALSPEDAAALDRADRILGASGQPPDPQASDRAEHFSIHAEAGTQTTVADLTGPEAISAIRVKLALPKDPEAERVLLRQLTISMTWDDEATPAVWSPLGDFFGYVGGAIPFKSLPTGLLEDGTFYSYWYMPFASRVHLVVGNDGPQAVDLDWEITHGPLTQPISALARFHAKWHRDAFPVTREDRQPDWTLLTTQGAGRYVGTHLHVWNPGGGWWGEGDDKFFVDGEKFPSSFGTGSEDYFGFAWSGSNLFSKPYHDQLLNEGNKGHADVNRWHIADSVSFQKSFDGCIEKYFPNSRGTLYAAEVFWYLSADGVDPYPAMPVSERVGYWVRPTSEMSAPVVK
jgi:hypothetical protein